MCDEFSPGYLAKAFTETVDQLLLCYEENKRLRAKVVDLIHELDNSDVVIEQLVAQLDQQELTIAALVGQHIGEAKEPSFGAN